MSEHSGRRRRTRRRKSLKADNRSKASLRDEIKCRMVEKAMIATDARSICAEFRSARDEALKKLEAFTKAFPDAKEWATVKGRGFSRRLSWALWFVLSGRV